ncbi:hypothetical protein V8C26DRAFT_407734, partial [Trichoderma gracile]
MEAPLSMLRHAIPAFLAKSRSMYSYHELQSQNGCVQILVVLPNTIRRRLLGCRCAL